MLHSIGANVYLGQGDGTFSFLVSLNAMSQQGCSAVVVGDFDGDGTFRILSNVFH